MKIKFRSRKRQGEWAELVFMAKAAELGFAVSKPQNHSAPYDVVIEKDGHVWLIQVKSAIERFTRTAFQVNARAYAAGRGAHTASAMWTSSWCG
jgi:streptogramin lyase